MRMLTFYTAHDYSSERAYYQGGQNERFSVPLDNKSNMIVIEMLSSHYFNYWFMDIDITC